MLLAPALARAGSPCNTRCLRRLCFSSQLKAGADVDAQDDEGNNPLHFATSRGAVDASRSLLRYGADPIASNNRRQSPLTMVMDASQQAALAKQPAEVEQPFVEPIQDFVEVTFEKEGSLGLAFAQ